MGEGLELDLFGLGGKEEKIIMPEENSLAENIDIKLEDITESNVDTAISGETVRSVLVRESSVMRTPYYVLDLRGLTNLTNAIFDALKTFLTANGDTDFYIRTKDKILSKGRIDREKDHMILKTVLDSLLGKDCKLYMNLGTKVEKVDTKDVRSVRLRL